VLRGSPTTDLWPKLGSGWLRRRSVAVAAGGCRWSFCSGEVAAWLGESAVREAPEDPRVAPGRFGEHRRRVEGELGDGGVPGRQWRAHAGTACSDLYSRASGAASSLSDEGPPALLRGTASTSAGALGRGTGDGSLGSARRRYGAVQDALAFQGRQARRGPHP
jgi:hypothetical protein